MVTILVKCSDPKFDGSSRIRFNDLLRDLVAGEFGVPVNAIPPVEYAACVPVSGSAKRVYVKVVARDEPVRRGTPSTEEFADTLLLMCEGFFHHIGMVTTETGCFADMGRGKSAFRSSRGERQPDPRTGLRFITTDV